ncbi:peptide ABC transporter permease [Legionella birminghamensis]|uniref:Peptide ABC transporter permease n=1 Tax=Legionella birminghamensis TaxID=28083 RepID=A0A378IB48_9GAMM|nr:ABC transporter permease [Legionella birminghamensis]KTC76113.1 peptide ABC transporter permease [Legionella birminghamensis]STX32263.1 peptide ABC transporter permease [Legionella birminghamensis]
MLWTDIFFLGMIIFVFAGLLWSLRKEPARLVLRKLFQRPIAIASGIILLFFLSIAILDSIHVEITKGSEAANVESKTLLDAILAPLDEVYENTYSAPMALHLYTTETAIIGDKIEQIYPRLSYPPAAIQTEQEKSSLIWGLILIAGGYSLLFWAGFSLLFILVRYLQGYRGLHFSPRLGVALGTLFICIFFSIASYQLSRHFHLFGTGKIGQDIFYYTIKSIRTGLVIGTLTTLFMLPLGIVLGIAAGYFGGIVDDIIQYIYTVLSSIPGVLLITASVLSMQTYIANHPQDFPTLEKSADARLFALCLILGITSWTSLCRLLRAEALKFREIDFVLAAKVLGTRTSRIIWKHLLPNMMPIVLISLVLDFSFLVLAEAVLSYVGVGVSPMTISWGNMINGARLELAREPLVWWPILAAFVFMFLLVLASNLFADAVRDALDPHQV